MWLVRESVEIEEENLNGSYRLATYGLKVRLQHQVGRKRYERELVSESSRLFRTDESFFGAGVSTWDPVLHIIMLKGRLPQGAKGDFEELSPLIWLCLPPEIGFQARHSTFLTNVNGNLMLKCLFSQLAAKNTS